MSEIGPVESLSAIVETIDNIFKRRIEEARSDINADLASLKQVHGQATTIAALTEALLRERLRRS